VKISEEELCDLVQRTAASVALTDEAAAERLKTQRQQREADKQPPRPSRPADRLRTLDPGISENLPTRVIPEPPDEPPALEPIFCPLDRTAMGVLVRGDSGEILDRSCGVCQLKESDIVQKGLGHLLHPLGGFKASMDRVKASLSTVPGAWR
jgi:hypothetical protein